MFIDRHHELNQLEELYKSDQAEMFVLYGRRRVGKTELIRAFCNEKLHLFFIATLSSDHDQLASFSQQIWSLTHNETPENFTFPSWDAAFHSLTDLPGRPVVVLDEFTYLISGNSAIPSILQKVWDESLKNSRVFLILCGSYIGMMETEILGYQAPLYGRRSGSYFLTPLDLSFVPSFFPKYTPIEQIEAWAVLGGMPYYLTAFSDEVDIFSNISAHILAPRGLLYHEPRLLLMEELREPRNYFSILRAIAQGRSRLNEIALGSGLGVSSSAAKYLDTLQQMRIVERCVPVSDRQPQKSKKGIYRIADQFLRFWFTYVHPYQAALDIGLVDAILSQRVRPTFNQFVSYAFEEAAKYYISKLALKGTLPFLPERIGSWWDRESEIDVVAISDHDNSVLFGECKWSVNPVGINVLEDLKSKSNRLLANHEWSHVSYYLFSKAGFTTALVETARKEHISLITPEMCLI